MAHRIDGKDVMVSTLLANQTCERNLLMIDNTTDLGMDPPHLRVLICCRTNIYAHVPSSRKVELVRLPTHRISA
jgi:hypothetical protein